MKDFIQSHIRHGLTFLAGVFTFLQTKGLLTADEASEATAQFNGISDLIAPLVAVIIVRVLIKLAGKVKWLDFLKFSNGGVNGTANVLLCVGALSMALGALSLTSCSNINYRVDGTGLDWEKEPVQVLPAERVTPLVDVPLDAVGLSGAVTVPLAIEPTK